jgi:uncharacterized protein YPO0396
MNDATTTSTLDQPLTIQPELIDESFYLTSITVFNWGPFHGRHSCVIDRRGTAIIGPTGSGKTTLIDALMTLLAQNPKYNLASTGGHESDRDLISYVRGVSGVESSHSENSHMARPGNTVTGLSASYSDGSQTISIGALFHVENSSNAAEDLKKHWFFARDLVDPLDTLLTLHHEGGKAAITRHARDTAGLRLSTSKKDYLAHVRGFFGVGENSFALLNRAAGLKQINSIDEIFRELVLEDSSSFERAGQVVSEFETLEGIYEELHTARLQRDSLLPVRQGKIEWEAATAELAEQRHLKMLLPLWFAVAAVKRWRAEVEKLELDKNDSAARLQVAESLAATLDGRVRALHEEYLKLGGSDIESLKALIAEKEKTAAGVRANAASYKSATAVLGLLGELDQTSFLHNQKQLSGVRSGAEREHAEARQIAIDLSAKLSQHKESERKLATEIREVENRPHSNIPAPFQTFRDLLANQLNLSETELPFIAEMIEVKAAEKHWQGAIERAIGSERLRILVPAHRMSEALQWINRRDNRLHVRVQSAGSSTAPPNPFDDGFVHKLNFRDHPLSEHVKFILSRRDRRCVGSIEALRDTDHAMTEEGTMSDRDGRFEKQDQKHLSADWMTGFDNRHLLNSLLEQQKEERNIIEHLTSENAACSRTENERAQKLVLISQMETLEFSQIDIVGVEVEIEFQRQRFAALTQPDSDASLAKDRFEKSEKELNTAREEVTKLSVKRATLKKDIESANRELDNALSRCSEKLEEEDLLLAEKAFPLDNGVTAHQLPNQERSAGLAMDAKIRALETQKSTIEIRLVRAMAAAKKEDTGALSSVGTEFQDLDSYIDRLTVLDTEALPEKRDRFLDYLNQSAGQGVTQLLTEIGNAVSLIQERVADLNATLSRVDFRRDQFLQLHAQNVGHASLQQMEAAQRKLRHMVLSTREDEGEGHYRALGEVVRLLKDAIGKRHTLGAQALLDPRHRLQFSVVEVDRATGRSSGARKGSQTGSGGEKEVMASYILTASLSYALCPPEASVPRYASIVLDEAFSKSSPAAAARIIEALRVFGLHPLFVTPNKEIALLKSHTRSAILVHNKNKRATLTSLTWEEIEDHARTRKSENTPGSPDSAKPSLP